MKEQRTVFPFPTAGFQLKQVQGEGWDLFFLGFGFGFFGLLFFNPGLSILNAELRLLIN